MLNLKEINTFKREVTVKVPSGDRNYKNVKFIAEFKLLDTDELASLRESDDEGGSILDEVLTGVEKVNTENGDDPLEACKKNVMVASAIVKTYLSVISQDEARKNSKK